MAGFKITNRAYVAPVDLGVAERAYNKLEESHQQTIATTSAAKASLAALDLNPEEDAWRQQQIAKIDSALNDNLLYGNASSAMDDVNYIIGDIASDPGMIGRLRAQKDYKDWQTRLDQSKLSEDYKNYYKEQNKYHYEDVVGEDGKIVGGTEWKPQEEWVDEVNLGSLMEGAIKMAAQEAGGGNQIRFLDAKGNPTTDPSKSVTGEWYDDRSSKWQRVTPEKLQQAMTAMIEATPGAKASLEQDYKIAKWKYNKSGGTNSDILDKNGVILTPEQYLAKRVDPMYAAASYNNVFTDVKYGDAVKAQIALQKSAAAGSGTSSQGRALIDILGSTSNPAQIDNFMPVEATAKINQNKGIATQILTDFGLIEGVDVDKDDSTKLYNLAQNITNPLQRATYIDALDTMFEERAYLNEVRNKINDPVKQQKFDAYNAIVSMGDKPSEDNPYYKQYTDWVNTYFGDSNTVMQAFSDNDAADDFIAAIGGADKLKALGIVQGTTSDGRISFTLDKSNWKSLYAFADAGAKAYDNKSFMDRVGNFFKRVVDSGDQSYQVDDDGNARLIGQPFTKANGIVNQSDPAASFYSMNKFMKDLKSNNDLVLEGGKLTVGQRSIAAATPDVAEVALMMKANPTEAGKLSAVFKVNNDEALNALRGSVDLVQTGAKAVGEDKDMFSDLTTDERRIYTQAIRNATENDVTINALQDPRSGDWGALVVVKGKTDDKGDVKYAPKTIFIPGAFDSATIARWNNDTAFKAVNDVNIYHAADRDLPITDNTAFANIGNYKLTPIDNGFAIVNNGKTVGAVDYETASKYREDYLNWKRTFNYIRGGVATEADMPSIDAMAKKVAGTLAELSGAPNNEDIVGYYYQNLLKNVYNLGK